MIMVNVRFESNQCVVVELQGKIIVVHRIFLVVRFPKRCLEVARDMRSVCTAPYPPPTPPKIQLPPSSKNLV